MTYEAIAFEMFEYVLPIVESNIESEYGNNKWKNGYGTEYFVEDCFNELSSEFKLEGSIEALFDENHDLYANIKPYYQTMYRQWMSHYY